MKHIFQEGNGTTDITLLLLHGTGGNEYDLLPLKEIIAPNVSVLSVRGNVLEFGMPRFFKRHAEGVFDEEDLIFRTKELYQFILEAEKQHNFSRDNLVAVGYSNGANIAASLMYHYDDALKGAILHHPMVPLRNKQLPNLSGTNILLTAGDQDPICPPEETIELENTLKSAGADVELFWVHGGGHQLMRQEVLKAKTWYEETYQLS